MCAYSVQPTWTNKTQHKVECMHTHKDKDFYM